MDIVKCRQCGFINSEIAEICRKCGVSLRNTLNYLLNPATKGSVKKISHFHILKNDYFAFLAACLPFVVWILFIGVLIFGIPAKEGKEMTGDKMRAANLIIFSIAILITFASGAFIWRRIKSIRRIFAAGEFVIGIINFVDFEKDRGRVEYAYRHNQQIHQSGSALMKNSQTRDFQVGDEIILLVDPVKPKRTLIPDLYVK